MAMEKGFCWGHTLCPEQFKKSNKQETPIYLYLQVNVKAVVFVFPDYLEYHFTIPKRGYMSFQHKD